MKKSSKASSERKVLVDYAISAHQASVTRACRLLKVSRTVYHYQPKQVDASELKQELLKLAQKHKRYGFEIMYQKLRQKGYSWNHKRVYREALGIKASVSLPAKRMTEFLDLIACRRRGYPLANTPGQRPEFVSQALLQWTAKELLELVLIEPGKPWQNGSNESFNGKFRDECLSIEWFRNGREAKVVIEDWRKHYNGVRPHRV